MKAFISAPLCCLFALLTTALPVQAQDDTAPADASLGRLFHTRQQRSILDELRRRNAPIGAEQQTDSISLEGIVRRSGGHSTIWINGKAHHDKAPVAAIGKHSARVFVGEGHTRELKVGESITLTPAGGQEQP